MSKTAAGKRTQRWGPRLFRVSLWFHKWLGVLIGLVMLALAVTGTFVAFKKEVEYLQPASRTGNQGEISNFLPPSAVAESVLGLKLPEATNLNDINRIELRPGKRMYKVRLEQTSAWSPPREIQVDAVTGGILNNGVRGDQFWMDLHSWAIFGELTKLIMMTFSGLALVWLTLTGLHMFLYPYWQKASRRRLAAQKSQATERRGALEVGV